MSNPIQLIDEFLAFVDNVATMQEVITLGERLFCRAKSIAAANDPAQAAAVQAAETAADVAEDVKFPPPK